MNRIKKQSILILINVRWWNATAFYAVNIARILHENGHKVIVGCNPAYPAFKRAEACGLSVAPLSFYGSNPLTLLRSLVCMCLLRQQSSNAFKESGMHVPFDPKTEN